MMSQLLHDNVSVKSLSLVTIWCTVNKVYDILISVGVNKRHL